MAREPRQRLKEGGWARMLELGKEEEDEAGMEEIDSPRWRVRPNRTSGGGAGASWGK
jgi:hypothetical protein